MTPTTASTTGGERRRRRGGGHDRRRRLLAHRPHRAPGEPIVLKNEGEHAHTATADDGEFDLGQVDAGRDLRPGHRARRARHLRVPLRDPPQHDRHAHRRGLSGASGAAAARRRAPRRLRRPRRRALPLRPPLARRRRPGRGRRAGDVPPRLARLGVLRPGPRRRSAPGCSPSCATWSSTSPGRAGARPPLAADDAAAERSASTTSSTGRSPLAGRGRARRARRRPPAGARGGALARPALRARSPTTSASPPAP